MFKSQNIIIFLTTLFLLSCKDNTQATINKKEFNFDNLLRNTDKYFAKSTIDTLYEQPKSLYFDDDNIKDTAKIQEKNSNELLNFILYIYLSSLNKTLEIPILNNSILYNNVEADYYLSDPIIKDKVIEIRIDYADRTTKPNISGEKKSLTENIKFRFNSKNKKIQIIGYDLSYIKDGKRNYKKSFNFITGKYYASCYLDREKKDTSGWAAELQNVYIDNWNSDFINKLLLYGNEIE
ncbi:hypothetical protein [Chryseobacterium sp. c4a]|uniref:hypothetical protein n=1 Tax=Chryseobacterium sp. c4a TaxID=1573582 RepID=UPI00135CBD16|nr:hypothetical protein [Chryseobacterium sp. c4a]